MGWKIGASSAPTVAPNLMRSSPWTFEAGAGVQHLGGCQRCSAHPKVPQPPPSPLAPIAAALKLLVALSARVLDRAHQPRLSRHPGQRGERGASQEERRTENLVGESLLLGVWCPGSVEKLPADWERGEAVQVRRVLLCGHGGPEGGGHQRVGLHSGAADALGKQHLAPAQREAR